jgi:hypothetical protein
MVVENSQSQRLDRLKSAMLEIDHGEIPGG